MNKIFMVLNHKATLIFLALLLFVAQSFGQSPGGVDTGLSLWLKADDSNNINVTTNTRVSEWYSRTPEGDIPFRSPSGERPGYVSEDRRYNFQPNLLFGGFAARLRPPTPSSDAEFLFTDSMTFYIVGSLERGGTNNREPLFAITGGSGWNQGMGIVGVDGSSRITAWRGDYGNGSLHPSVTPPYQRGDKRAMLINASFSEGGGATNQTNSIAINSAMPNLKTPPLGTYDLTNSNRPYLGFAQSGRLLQGSIAEVILYGAIHSDSDRNKIESYLAVKYGITRDQTTPKAYVASDGTTNIWTPSTSFKNRIAAIGTDSGSGLAVTKSHSINDGSILTVETSLGSALPDMEFMSWASDNRRRSAVTEDNVGALRYDVRTRRIWEVQSNVSSGNLTFTFDISDIKMDNEQIDDEYAILIYDSPDLTGTPDVVNPIGYAAATQSRSEMVFPNVPASYFLGGNKYIVLAVPILLSPGGVEQNLGIWLRADRTFGTDSLVNLDRVADYNVANAVLAAGTLKQTPDNIKYNYNTSLDFEGDTYYSIASDNNVMKSSKKDFFVVGDYGLGTNTPNDYDVFFTRTGRNGNWDNGYGLTRITEQKNVTFWHRTYSNSDTDVNRTPRLSAPDDRPSLYSARWTNFGNPNKTQSISVDGSVPNSITTSITAAQATGADFFIGAAPSSATTEYYLSGSMGELIFYAVGFNQISGTSTNGFPVQNLLDEEKNRVESYLALKYGISLDQTVPQHYLSSDGTVMWDTITANKTFTKNITGIGRDLYSDLIQPKSLSKHEGALVQMEATEALLHGDFMFWAGDKDTHNWSTPGGSLFSLLEIDENLETTWQIQERIGTVGEVTVSVADSLVGVEGLERLYLYVSTDPANVFSGTETEMTLNATTERWEVGYDFADGTYFGFRRIVSNLPSIWFKADAGTSTTSSGSELTEWESYGRTAGYAAKNEVIGTVPAAPPTYYNEIAENINFNPVVAFDGVDDHLATMGRNGELPGAYTIYSVALPDPSGSSTILGGEGLNELSPVHGYSLSNSTGNLVIMYGRDRVNFQNLPDNDSLPSILNQTFDDGSGIISGWHLQNSELDILSDYMGFSSFPNTPTNWFLGRRSGGSLLVGKLAELMMLENVSAVDHEKIRTYLSVKYGITYPANYISSDGTQYFTYANTTHDVAGIGKDDEMLLNQKQGKSVNADAILAVASGSSMEETNSANTSDLTNLSFLMWSNNDGANTWRNLGDDAPVDYSRLERVWEFGGIGGGLADDFVLQFTLDNSDFDVPSASGYFVCIDKDDDGSFSDETEADLIPVNLLGAKAEIITTRGEIAGKRIALIQGSAIGRRRIIIAE